MINLECNRNVILEVFERGLECDNEISSHAN